MWCPRSAIVTTVYPKSESFVQKESVAEVGSFSRHAGPSGLRPDHHSLATQSPAILRLVGSSSHDFTKGNFSRIVPWVTPPHSSFVHHLFFLSDFFGFILTMTGHQGNWRLIPGAAEVTSVFCTDCGDPVSYHLACPFSPGQPWPSPLCSLPGHFPGTRHHAQPTPAGPLPHRHGAGCEEPGLLGVRPGPASLF